MSAFNPDEIKEYSEYGSLKELISDCTEVLIPPERMTVWQAAEKYRVVDNAPMYVGPWDNKLGAYLKEPMEMLESKCHSSVCMVAPAQSMKTEVILNWLSYNVKCDPSDFMIVEKNESEAGNFSKMKVDKLIRRSPEIKAKLVKRRTADNVYNKQFVSGAFLLMTSPTENSLSGKSIRRIALTDYDRMPTNIGGEGSAFDLGRRRTTSYKRLGMTYVESSPSRDCLDSSWKHIEGSHRGPPVTGIVEIFNRGDMRLYYWQCPHCREWFEPDFRTIRWPNSNDIMECAEAAYMACPHCFNDNGAVITQDMRGELNEHGTWLKEGQRINAQGVVKGKGLVTDIASFWLKGPATAFGQWKTMVNNYLIAKQTLELTGDDKPLKTTVNTDQGGVYTPPNVKESRSPEDLMSRAKDIGDRLVPDECRLLIGTVDVQKRYFSVQINGVMPVIKPSEAGSPIVMFDYVTIDRFDIIKSSRLDADGDPMRLEPCVYEEDWQKLTEKVIEAAYQITGQDDQFMRVKAVVCDSGGAVGATEMAYKFWLRCKRDGLDDRFFLMKGEPKRSAPTVSKHWPDTKTKSNAVARGQIPVWFMNSNLLKDQLENILSKTTKGGNYWHFPDWLDLYFYKELCAETKNIKGDWENPNKRRNESTDHCYMTLGVVRMLGLIRLDWENPPLWAQHWSMNNMVVSTKDDALDKPSNGTLSIEDLGRLLG